MSKNNPCKSEVNLRHKNIQLNNREIIVYQEVSSTNTVAQTMALNGAKEGTIVISKFQTLGRGRMQRQWVCPTGKGILMSMILRPKLSIQFTSQLTLLTSVAMTETIRKITRCEAGIKWPNDIVLGGKKVCGILAQSNISINDTGYVIIGIGLNVNQDESQLPTDCKETSTSLRLEMGQKVSRHNVLNQFIIIWDKHYQMFLEKGYPYLREKWIENNITLGEYVSINRGDGSNEGLAIDISERGGLILSLPNGIVEEFLADDLSLGRSYYEKELEKK